MEFKELFVPETNITIVQTWKGCANRELPANIFKLLSKYQDAHRNIRSYIERLSVKDEFMDFCTLRKLFLVSL